MTKVTILCEDNTHERFIRQSGLKDDAPMALHQACQELQRLRL